MKLSRKIVTGALLMISVPTFAQFTLDGEIRPRFEYRNGFKNVLDSTQNHAAFVDQRTRLNFGYKTEGYIFKLTLQDIHVWGSQPQLIATQAQQNKNGTYLSLHEAWGEALISKKWAFKLGRQEIVLDNHRIFGNVGWAQQARSHDAAIIKFKTDKTQVQIAGAYNQDKAALTDTKAFNGSYKALQYFWLHQNFSEQVGASVLFLNNGIQVTDSNRTNPATPFAIYKDNYSQTAGTHLTYKKNKLEIAGAFYYQFGTFGDVANSDIEAFNFSIDLTYKATKKLTIAAGYEYLSGQSQTDTSKSYQETKHAFNPFYGTNHKFNGFMDYFYVGNHIGSVGLQDAFIKLNYKHEKFWIGAGAHVFLAAEDVRDGFKVQEDLKAAIAAGTPTRDVNLFPAMNSYLGTEIDVTFGFQLAKGVDFKGGYSIMINSETLSSLKGVTDFKNQGITGNHNGWGWAMVTIKPKFITGEEKKTN